MTGYPWDDEIPMVIDAVAYNAWPHAATVITARKAHTCVMADDVSWARACHPVHAGEKYIRVRVFRPQGRPPVTAAVCAACADGCPTLPRIPEESP